MMKTEGTQIKLTIVKEKKWSNLLRAPTSGDPHKYRPTPRKRPIIPAGLHGAGGLIDGMVDARA